jgi:hypothetical protein
VDLRAAALFCELSIARADGSSRILLARVSRIEVQESANREAGGSALRSRPSRFSLRTARQQGLCPGCSAGAQASAGLILTRTGAAFVIGLPIRILIQSYSNSLPQSRQTTCTGPSGLPGFVRGDIGRVRCLWVQRNSNKFTISLITSPP